MKEMNAEDTIEKVHSGGSLGKVNGCDFDSRSRSCLVQENIVIKLLALILRKKMCKRLQKILCQAVLLDES